MQKARIKSSDIIPTESDEQQSLFRYCSVELSRYPELDMLSHTPNEGKRTKATGARLKREGLRKGYPDITLDVARCGYHGLKIELKRIKNYTITQEQKDWIMKLNEQGYAAVFCFGWEHAWRIIENYLKGRLGVIAGERMKSIEMAQKERKNVK